LQVKADGLYIHFPFCQHLCNYCDFYKKPISLNDVTAFEEQLVKHINQLGFVNFRELKTLYLGGGTPSLWGKRGSEFLLDFMDAHNIKLNKDAEVTLEVDPDSWSESDIEAWIEFGVNRFSLGVQAFEESSLSILDRQHTIGDVEKTLKYFSERDLNFSVDFLLGAPVVNRNITSELEKALSYKPKHFSVYILKTRANYPLRDQEPNEVETADEYIEVSNLLKDNGYLHYEVSNFARAGFESKHNLSYWDLSNVLAIGPNATGFYLNNKTPIRYQVAAQSNKLVNEELDNEAYRLERFYLGLRTNKGINPSLFISEEDWNKMDEVFEYWNENAALDTYRYDKLILNSEGYLMLDSLIDEFFKYTDL